MATLTDDQVSQDYYQSQLSLRAQAVADFAQFWPLLDVNNLDRSFPGYVSAIVHFFDSHRSRAVTLANEYFGTLRSLASAPGGWTPVPAEDIPFDQIWASLLATGPIAIKQAVRKGWSPQRALGTAFTGSAGAATRLILNAGRDQILANTRSDREALGWYRVASPRACAFCAMLASRGPVYQSKATATFRSHDHCVCYARPMWTADQASPSTTERFEQLWGDSSGRPGGNADADPSNKRLNEFRRELYANRDI
jgi:hypothetical protein